LQHVSMFLLVPATGWVKACFSSGSLMPIPSKSVHLRRWQNKQTKQKNTKLWIG
jgi:hypothetical protein